MTTTLVRIITLCMAALAVALPARAENAPTPDELERAVAEQDLDDVPDGLAPDFYVALLNRVLDETRRLTSTRYLYDYVDAFDAIDRNLEGQTAEKYVDARETAFQRRVRAFSALKDFGELEATLERERKRGDAERFQLAYSEFKRTRIYKSLQNEDWDVIRKTANDVADDFAKGDIDVRVFSDLQTSLFMLDSEIGRGMRARALELLQDATDEESRQFCERMAAQERFDSLVGAELELEGIYSDGSKFNWKDYRGKVVIVDFWSTHCGPCCAELPELVQLYEKYSERGLVFLGFSFDDDVDELNAFTKKQSLPWKQISRALSIRSAEARGESFQDASKYYDIRVEPTKIIVDRDGRVLYTLIGAKVPELKNMLRQIFQEDDAQE